MATQLNTANHTTLNTSMTDLFKSGSFSGVKMSIYTDAEATTIATDSAGNIENRKISQILKTASYTDPKTNQIVKPQIKIIFADGTSLVSVDNVDTYYYVIAGEAHILKTF
tara:strand:- start:911 stop:1243 length:333 start_codon:yes stop_codon:yes gene_type:complete